MTELSAAEIAANLARLNARIAAAALGARRRAEDVHLVAVSKTHPAEAVLAALAAGQLAFGENRVQEAADKFPALRAAHPGLRLHLIGGLQTNKAREAVRVADVIDLLAPDLPTPVYSRLPTHGYDRSTSARRCCARRPGQAG